MSLTLHARCLQRKFMQACYPSSVLYGHWRWQMHHKRIYALAQRKSSAKLFKRTSLAHITWSCPARSAPQDEFQWEDDTGAQQNRELLFVKSVDLRSCMGTYGRRRRSSWWCMCVDGCYSLSRDSRWKWRERATKGVRERENKRVREA